MEIQLLTVPDCPNRSTTLAHLREALGALGDPAITIVERLASVEDEAQAAGMHGSPTILVDGRDPFAVTGTTASVSCRLYPSDDGLRGAPSVAELLAVLSAHLGAADVAGADCSRGIPIQGPDLEDEVAAVGRRAWADAAGRLA